MNNQSALDNNKLETGWNWNGFTVIVVTPSLDSSQPNTRLNLPRAKLKYTLCLLE